MVYESHAHPWSRNCPGGAQDAWADRLAARIAADFASHAGWNVPGYIGKFKVLADDAAPASAGRSGATRPSTASRPTSGANRDPTRWIARSDPQTDDTGAIARDWSS